MVGNLSFTVKYAKDLQRNDTAINRPLDTVAGVTYAIVS